MEQIYYYDAPHKYYGVETGLEYMPVSTLAHHFEPDIPWDKIKEAIALREEVTPEIVQSWWDKKKDHGTTVGTQVHLSKENYTFDVGYMDFEGERYTAVPYRMDGDKKFQIKELKGGYIYPELITGVTAGNLRIAGTSDCVLISNSLIVNIIDYKTDQSIEYTSKYNQFLKPPLNQLPASNFWMYSLKMSMYMYFILRENPLFIPGKIFILHEVMMRDKEGMAVLRDGKPTILKEEWHEVDYLFMEPYVKAALNQMYLWTKKH